MRNLRIGVLTAAALVGLVPAHAQVSATQRAGFNLPAGQTPAPNTPGGAVVIGSNLYTGDGANGFRHWRPADPANPDPINSGILVFDTSPGFSLGGGGLCIFFCQVGQIAYDGNQTAYIASYDHPKGNGISFPGVWGIAIDPVTGQLSGATQLVPNAGLAGNNPTAIALGPDGNLYVGFLKNGNVVRIVNPTANPQDPVQGKTQIVQSVGTAPNGRPVRALAFVGPDLYLASSDGLSVIKNAVAATCLGTCNGVRVADGFTGIDHVGLTSDGLKRLYMAVAGQVVRFTVATGSTTPISISGTDPTGAVLPFAFVGGHSNLLQLDRLGNLWIGDDISDGRANFDGRIWYISAAVLSPIP
jgi:hypothetical protein